MKTKNETKKDALIRRCNEHIEFAMVTKKYSLASFFEEIVEYIKNTTYEK